MFSILKINKRGAQVNMLIKSLFASSKFLLFLIFIGFGYSSNAQVNFYTFGGSYTPYIPLSASATVAYSGAWDDHTAGSAVQATIPFSFNFDGTNYTQCYISPNGFITFGGTQPTPTNYTPLSSNEGYAGAISPFGVNLKSGGSDIVYETIGTSPNRVFVVQWKDAVRVGDAGLTKGLFTFQIRLNETTNIVDFSYGVSNQGSGNTLFPIQVGLRGPSNNFAQADVINRYSSLDQSWSSTNTIAGGNNSVTLKTTNVAGPQVNLLFKWTPSIPCVTPPSQPSNLIFGTKTSTTINGSFTAASPVPTGGYLVLRSAVNTPPTAATIINGTFYPSGGIGIYNVVGNTTTTTFSSLSLSANTTYYYWVIPYSSKCSGAPYYNLTNVLTGNATTCLGITNATPATTIMSDSFTANWSALAGATSYQLDVSTNSSFTTFVTGYNNLDVGNVTTLNITGLIPATTYYYRVRGIDILRGGCGANGGFVESLTTLCGIFPIPYSQDFNSTALGAVPSCYTLIDSNSDATQWGASTSAFSSSPQSLLINTNPTLAMDDWFILPGLNLTGGVSYRLSFYYNTESATTTENLKVYFGNGNTIGDMTNTLLDLSNINNTTFKLVYVDFTPVTTGAYYIGFEGYSLANQSFLAVDDIKVEVSPTCFEPTDLIVSNIATTTATVSWTPPVPNPAEGYEYYLSTDPSAPTGATIPAGTVGFGINTVNLTGLSTSTTYYVWVRGKCSISDSSIWSIETSFSAECNPPIVTSTTDGDRCGYGVVTIGAIPNATSTINWYDAASGGNLIGTGNTYTTPALNGTTTYYAEANAAGAIANTGPSSPITQGGTIVVQNYNIDGYIKFTVFNNTKLQSIDIFPQASGQNGTITLRNSSLVNIVSFPFVTSGVSGNIAQTIPINYTLAPGDYNLYLEVAPSSGIAMNNSNTAYPYTSIAASIDNTGLGNSVYLGFYNWKFTTECLSPRAAVVATINPSPLLTVSSPSETICDTKTTSVITVSGYASFDTYVWSPDTDRSGSFASGFTFNPMTTTTYTLIASNSSTQCSSIVEFTVNVLPSPPSNITITPAAATICNTSIQPLVGAAPADFLVTILNQDFNGVNDWTVSQTSINGDVDASKWTLRTSPYTYSRPSLTTNFSSNDNSKFYLANSDSQSTDNNMTCITTLQSPYFSLVGAASASINFWQYIRYTGNDKFLVEVTIDGGVTWTPVIQYLNNQGTSTGFVNSGDISLDAFVNNAAVSVRFKYEAGWKYYWAIDNVVISANLSLGLSWSPVTDLYKDAGATVPYTIGELVNNVYAKPSVTSTYTATLTGINGCKSTKAMTILVDELPIGGTLSSDQELCSGNAPSNLTLAGQSGTIVEWQYADDAAFTIGVTPIANTTTTLSPAQMGSISTIRYFRVVMKNGVCAFAYSNVVYVSYASTTWDGSTWSNGFPNSNKKAIFTFDYTATGDMYACAVQVTSGTVTFNSNTNLIVSNEVVVASGGTLVFANNASLVQINNTVNSGNITYKRNTTPVLKYDYTYWSSPVSPQTLVAFSPNTFYNKYFSFNAVTQQWKTENRNSLMTSGKGYIIRTPDISPFNSSTRNVFNGLFYGTPNNGDISVAVVGGPTKQNFIGNPYPSAISANLFLADITNATVLAGTIYLWTHNTPITGGQYSFDDFATYNYSGGTGTKAPNSGINNSVPNGMIASGQGFIINGGASSGMATFKNSMRIIGNNSQFFKMNPSSENVNTTIQNYERHRLWLDINGEQGSFKQILVGYIENATNGIDRGYDGDLLESENPISLYSIIDDSRLTIQGRALPFNDSDIVPLGYKSKVASSYTISLSNFDGLFDYQDVYLEDKVLNQIINLKEKNHTFSTNSGAFNDRFVLKYTSNLLGVVKSDFNENAVVVYKKEGNWIVNSGKTPMLSVTVYDVRGRLLYAKNKLNTTQTSFNVGDTNQVLLVNIISEEGGNVTKKVVN